MEKNKFDRTRPALLDAASSWDPKVPRTKKMTEKNQSKDIYKNCTRPCHGGTENSQCDGSALVQDNKFLRDAEGEAYSTMSQ